jgi:hypothetical protein
MQGLSECTAAEPVLSNFHPFCFLPLSLLPFVHYTSSHDMLNAQGSHAAATAVPLVSKRLESLPGRRVRALSLWTMISCNCFIGWQPRLAFGWFGRIVFFPQNYFMTID